MLSASNPYVCLQKYFKNSRYFNTLFRFLSEKRFKYGQRGPKYWHYKLVYHVCLKPIVHSVSVVWFFDRSVYRMDDFRILTFPNFIKI